MGVRPASRQTLTADERRLLDQLVRQCGPRLLAYVRQVYGDRLDAEEIVAETFCRAVTNMATLQRCQRHDLYLLTIARNLCRDHLRRPRRCGADTALADCPARDPAPPESLSQRQQYSALRQAVAGLPEAQREVLMLRLATDLKFEEIAALLGVPLGTALSRMHAAIRRLKAQMECVREH